MDAEAELMELKTELADERALERVELTEDAELAEDERELEVRLALEELVVVWAAAMALRAATTRSWNCMLLVGLRKRILSV